MSPSLSPKRTKTTSCPWILSASTPPFVTSPANGNQEEQLHLPPGRPTSRFWSLFFDDSLRLLNAKTMGSYQCRRHKQYGPVFKTNIFFRPTVFCTSRESLTELAQEEARSSSMQSFFPPHHQSLFGQQSLLVQSGATHDKLRRLIQPSLSPRLMTNLYQPIIDQAMDDFVAKLARDARTDHVEVVPELRSFFISVALQILLGQASQVPEGLEEDLTIWSKGLLAAPLTFVPWSTAAKALRARKRICETLAPLLEEERIKLTTAANATSANDIAAPSRGNSLLERLVSSVDDQGNRLSDRDILDNVLTIIFAGSDTTASAATSLWMTLSLHPTLKQKLKEDPSSISVFVKKVLEEYPPAPFSLRLAKEPLSVKGYDIPANWLVVYGFAGALLTNKQETSWDEMFRSNNGDNMQNNNDDDDKSSGFASSSPSTSVAFGAGPRMCPGRYLAALELTTLCQKLLDYDWEIKQDQNLLQTYNPGFFPKDGLQLKFS